MDSLRGPLADHDDASSVAAVESDTDTNTAGKLAGGDERRMQVRAYNFWAGLLADRAFPDVANLHPEQLDDFGPRSVLLDFTEGLENPAIAYLGAQLRQECDSEGPILRLADVPARSLLSRITDHYLQIIANQAPIGFEAEFVNHRGATILYRGILLPFSRDGHAIDFIYGVINWKEAPLSAASDQNRERPVESRPAMLRDPIQAPLTEWADGPVDFSPAHDEPTFSGALSFPEPGFLLPTDFETNGHPALESTPLGLADWLVAAREQALAARSSEERSHQALYAAIGRAHDFALAAAEAPEDFAELLEDAGIAVQDRAPFTPIAKLVFGSDYDRTRLAEFATALSHARRLSLPIGSLADHLDQFPGGLKGLVRTERALRRKDEPTRQTTASARVANRLRTLEARSFSDVATAGAEFTVLVARRLPDGQVVLVGEIDGDDALLQRAARHLLP